MRSCRHCAHENADHLAFCSQCRPKTAPHRRWTAGRQPAHDRDPAPTRGRCWRRRARSDDGGTPSPARGRCSTGRCRPSGRASAGAPAPTACRSRVRWLGESIGYIYVYLRGKLDAGEHRRRLLEERSGAETLLAGALNELGQIGPARRGRSTPSYGIARGDRTGARASRGGGRRRGDVGISAAERGDAAGEPAVGRRGRMGRRRQGQPRVRADLARGDRRSPHDGHASGARRGRAGADRTRHQRRAAPSATPGSRSWRTTPPGSRQSSARWKRTPSGSTRSSQTCAPRRRRCATPPRRRRRSWIRSSPARRQAASAMAASIAGRMRDRVDAEREIGDLTAQIGRVAADVRPPHAALLSAYQNIDRLTETIGDPQRPSGRDRQARSHYDHRKLLAGLGLVDCMLRRDLRGALEAAQSRARAERPSAISATPGPPSAAAPPIGVTAPSSSRPVIASR